jgi:hypothetical protein
MLTRCPQCLAVHPLEADRPEGDDGSFVCPDCGATFDAYAHLTEVVDAFVLPVESNAIPHFDDIPEEQGELFGPRPKPRAAPLPSFARRRVRLPRPAQLRWWLVSGGLLLLLIALYPIADRARLATDPAWRPKLASMCAALRCTLPPWRELSAFEVTARDVRPHPSVAKALLITASFRNDARFAQAWPLLELRMSDLNGRDIGLRRFRPKEYLGGVLPTPTIAAGQTVNATLEVVDPGRDAVAFAFDFR